MSTIYLNELNGIRISHSLDSHPDKSNFPMHVHNLNEIFLFISGSASYLVEGNEYPLLPGCMLLIRESESHAINFIADEPYERYVIQFSSNLPLLDALDPEKRLLLPFYDRPLGMGNMYEPSELGHNSVLTYMKTMCRGKDDYERRTSLLSHFPCLLQDILTAYRRKNTSEKHLRDTMPEAEIVAFINEHLFEELTVPLIASHFYMSVSQLERIFKRATHSSVWHYITVKRLSAARTRIEGGMSAALAGAECGFGDYSSFYRAYTKEFGTSPVISAKVKQDR